MLSNAQVLSEVPEPPAYLGEVAKEYWRRVGSQLVESKSLTSLHLEAFSMLCEKWQEYRQLADWLAADPSRATYTSERGYQSESPQVRMRAAAEASLQRLWAKFFLTPHAYSQRKKSNADTAQKTSIAEFAKRKYDQDQE